METEIIELEQQALEIDEKARQLTVKNQEQYNIADKFILTIKGLQKEIKETFAPMKKKASDAHKEVVAQETKHLDPLVKAESFIKEKMLIWLNEQEEIRQEQERKLQVEAEKKRQEAIAKAEAAREQGKEAKAEKYEEKAAQIVAPILAPTANKGSASMREYWSAEVIDLLTLVKAVADGKASIMAIQPDMTFLNKQAEALKGTMNYPGVRAISRKGLAIRR